MPDFALPILYALLFANAIYRTRFFSGDPGKFFLLAIFFLKCAFSVVYWQVHTKAYGGGDTYFYFMDGEIIGHTLEHGPWKYLQLVFGFNGGYPPPAINTEIDLMGFWHDTSAYMVVRFNAIVYLFSFGNPYVHGIFMAFLSLSGLTALYKGLIAVLAKNHGWIKFCVFGIPSVLFWTSGVHKEGLLIFGLGFFFYSLLSIGPGQRNLKYINMLILSALLIFLVRDFIFYLLLPGFFAYQASKVFPRLGLVFLVSIYILFIAVGPQLDFIRGNRNYLNSMADKQTKFTELENGKTNIKAVPFDPSTMGMMKSLPMAVYNATLRPLSLGLWPAGHGFVFLETLLLLGLGVFSIAYFNWREWYYDPLLAWMFCFGFSFLCLIGIVVPNIGAIIRYRSLALPFVFIPLLYFVKPVLDRVKKIVRK